MAAIQNRQWNAIKWLVEPDGRRIPCDVNLKAKNGNTALMAGAGLNLEPKARSELLDLLLGVSTTNNFCSKHSSYQRTALCSLQPAMFCVKAYHYP